MGCTRASAWGSELSRLPARVLGEGGYGARLVQKKNAEEMGVLLTRLQRNTRGTLFLGAWDGTSPLLTSPAGNNGVGKADLMLALNRG